MARVDVQQDEVLERFVARLRDQLNLGPSHCFIVSDPALRVPPPVGGEYFVTVAGGAGQFDDGMQDGGGAEQLMETWTVTVTVYTRVKLDQSGHDDKLLVDTNRGLLRLKRPVLKALVGHDLVTEDGDNNFLRRFLYAISCGHPQYDAGKAIGWLSIDFGVAWDWDL